MPDLSLMKNALLLLLCFCFALSGCHKEDVAAKYEKLATNTRIKYIIKEKNSYLNKVRDTFLFKYNRDRISGLNDFDFIYDQQNRLIQIGKITADTAETHSMVNLVSYKYDTVFYNYYWQGNKVILIKDSVMTGRVSYTDQQLSSSAYRRSVSAYSQIFYNGDQIDSIDYNAFEKQSLITNDQKPIFQTFSYDRKGNVSRIHSQIFMNRPIPPDVGVPAYNVPDAVADFEYDDHPNPYYILYQQLGIFIAGMEEISLSPNNITASETRIDMGDGDVNVSIKYQYEYNSKGLPVTVKAVNPITSEVIGATKFGYY